MARRQDLAVKIDAEIARKAKIVAAHKELSLAEYVSEVLRPVVERELLAYSRQAISEAEKTVDPKSKSKPKNPNG